MKTVGRRGSMKGKIRWVAIVSTLVFGTLLVTSGIANATIYEISAGSTQYLTYTLESGDEIIWDWHVVTSRENIDFWIENTQGTKYSYQKGLTSWASSFTVPTSGTWCVQWYNDNLLFPVTVEYDVSIYHPPPPSSDSSGKTPSFEFGAAIICIAVATILFQCYMKRRRIERK
jgi:hypothetical protein